MSSTWFSIRDAKPAEPVEILIYDQIGKDWFGGDGVSSKEFAEALKGIDNKRQIRVCINSPGGNVWDGLAIYNMLRARKENVTCRVDGVAASIASVIALGGGKLEMPKNSLMMIHDPSGLVMGNAEDMREMADQLEKHADILAGIYAEKSGKSREKMRSLMRDETWFTGDEAQAMGLCDFAMEPVKIAANFDFKAFRRVPAALAKTNNTPPQAAAGQHTPNKMQTEKILALLAKHGKSLTAEATEEQILAALSALVT
ncbi:MAG: head maturation protease, ClpP-related, partial [Arenimonas sp.]|uniref:head maturation protease, ClpP-related n=1 Tax=Arenimonas sp. TaxID=1872635 RepID=UPI003BFE5D78